MRPAATPQGDKLNTDGTPRTITLERTPISAQIALQQEISAANQRFMDAFKRDDLAGVAACYTEDAQFLIPHMAPIHGRAAIEAVFRAGRANIACHRSASIATMSVPVRS